MGLNLDKAMARNYIFTWCSCATMVSSSDKLFDKTKFLIWFKIHSSWVADTASTKVPVFSFGIPSVVSITLKSHFLLQSKVHLLHCFWHRSSVSQGKLPEEFVLIAWQIPRSSGTVTLQTVAVELNKATIVKYYTFKSTVYNKIQ